MFSIVEHLIKNNDFLLKFISYKKNFQQFPSFKSGKNNDNNKISKLQQRHDEIKEIRDSKFFSLQQLIGETLKICMNFTTRIFCDSLLFCSCLNFKINVYTMKKLKNTQNIE